MDRFGLPVHRTAALAMPALLALAGAATAQGLPPIEREFSNGSTLLFYGQINKGVLSYDDGRDTESYALIDNDNSDTRFGLSYTLSIGDWAFKNVNEFSYAPYATSNINIVDNSPDSDAYEFNNTNIRKIDFTLEQARYGKFWLGQGSMATDGIAQIDLSDTDVIAYSSVEDSAKAQIIRFSAPGLSFDGSLSGIEIGDVYANFDGDRRVRVRYDTPEISGFTFAAAFGRNLLSDDQDTREENLADASLTYAGKFDTIKVAAGLGYYWQENDATSWAGSASALHAPTGLNFTVSAGSLDDNGDNATYWYTKLGLLRDVIAWGATAVSLDYYSGDNLYLDSDAGITSSSSKSWGLAVVQNIDRANTELWLTWRSYDYADNAASYEDGQAIFGGARFKF